MSNKPVERAFIYCRQSRTDAADGDKSLSLLSQERLLRDAADERGMVVVGVEVDANLRGWQDESERPGLARILERARAGEFDALMFYDISRVARDVFMLERLVRDLDRSGVRPISLKEPQIEDAFYRQILGAIAEKYTRDLSAHAKRGLAERARRGKTHAPAPYGLVKFDGVLAPGAPDCVAVVREAFERFALRRETYTEIVADLNARGVLNARGRQWNTVGLAWLLRNPAYAGDVVVGETTVRDAHEAIVPRELYDLAQEAADARKRHRRKRKDAESWLESFTLHECGARAYLVAGDGTQAPYFRCLHACPSRRSWPSAPEPCDARPKSKKADDLESEVWSTVVADLLARLPPETAAAEARRRYAERAPDADRARREIERALARLDAQFARAETLYLDGARSRDWLNDREAEIAGERAVLMARLEVLPPQPDDQAIRDAAAILGKLGESGALAHMPGEIRRQIMARLGVATYGPSGVLVWYAPEIAPLIPGARSFSDDGMTIAKVVLTPSLLTSLREAHEANRRTMAAIQAA